MIRRLAAGCTLAVSVIACTTGPGESTPPALRSFLTSLEAGRLGEAYEITQLDELAGSLDPGAAVTRAHFIASWKANPLASYEITEIIRLRRRDIEDFGEGDPYFETMVRLSTTASSWTANIGVEGEIAGTVIVDTYPVRLEGTPRDASVRVDGIPLDVGATPDGVIQLLLLGGRHDIQIGTTHVLIEAARLAVVEGPAVIDESVPRTIRLHRSGT